MWFRSSIKAQDITQLTRQLSTLLKVNINLLTAFDLLQESFIKPRLTELITHLSQTIKQGKLLSQSLAQFPQYFDHCYCALIAIGEQSNRLDHSFEQLAQQRERQAELHNKLRSALTYPCLMLVVALLIGIILLLKVAPQFEHLYQST